MLLELPRVLLQFNAPGPELPELFQLPDAIAHMLRRLPYHFTISDDPAADHPAQFVHQPRERQIPMLAKRGWDVSFVPVDREGRIDPDAVDTIRAKMPVLSDRRANLYS